MKLRVATWNIAAARKLQSTRRFDYTTEEQFDYFAEQLYALKLDVVCLQESQVNKDDSLSKRLAERLQMPFISETVECPSHIDRAYNLSLAIMSKKPFESEAAILLPKPMFELKFTYSGQVVPPYDRYAQLVTFEQFTVANMHTEPLVAFGLRYDEGAGKTYAHEIDKLLTQQLIAPLIFAADFNVHDVANAFPLTVGSHRLRDALLNKPTKPDIDSHPDHILYSPKMRCTDAGIVKTQTDHFLCCAEFEI
jgi:exonuclease III